MKPFVIILIWGWNYEQMLEFVMIESLITKKCFLTPGCFYVTVGLNAFSFNLQQYFQCHLPYLLISTAILCFSLLIFILNQNKLINKPIFINTLNKILFLSKHLMDILILDYFLIYHVYSSILYLLNIITLASFYTSVYVLNFISIFYLFQKLSGSLSTFNPLISNYFFILTKSFEFIH